MTRRIEQVQGVIPAVLRAVWKRDGLALDRNPPFPLDIHVVEDLVLKVAVIDDAGELDQAIRQRRLPMVDMRDDAEISDRVHKPSTLFLEANLSRLPRLVNVQKKRDRP